MENCLVTGGLGFIGNELVRQLDAMGNICVLDNEQRRAPHMDDLATVPVYRGWISPSAPQRSMPSRMQLRQLYFISPAFTLFLNATPLLTKPFASIWKERSTSSTHALKLA